MEEAVARNKAPAQVARSRKRHGVGMGEEGMDVVSRAGPD